MEGRDVGTARAAARLTRNQKKIVAAAIIGDMLDYFDFGLIGFALAFIVGPWKLTYGQSAMILLTSGIGGVPGALFYGWLADRVGRRKVFIATALNFSLATGVMALTPDQGGWIFLSICRFFVGFGVAGLFTVDLPLVQEFVPTSKRGLVGGLVTSLLPLGSIMGAVLGAFVTPGHRLARAVRDRSAPGVRDPADPRVGPGIAALADPHGAARRGAPVARLGAQDRPEARFGCRRAPRAAATAWRELFRYPRSMVLSADQSRVPVRRDRDRAVEHDAARAAVQDQTRGGLVPDDLRRPCRPWSDASSSPICRTRSGADRPASLLGFGAALSLALAGYYHDVFIGGVSVFYLMLFGQRFFGDGGYAVVGPYAAEVWPARLRASGMGFGFGLGNFGKILGPLGLALIVGSSDVISPKATIAAIEPAMIYLAAGTRSPASSSCVGIETKGRSIEELDAALDGHVAPRFSRSPRGRSRDRQRRGEFSERV